MVDFNSFTYPYERVQGSFNTLKGAEEIPYKILTYLMNLPDKNGYVPQDNNENPRVRLMKYPPLWAVESLIKAYNSEILEILIIIIIIMNVKTTFYLDFVKKKNLGILKYH